MCVNTVCTRVYAGVVQCGANNESAAVQTAQRRGVSTQMYDGFIFIFCLTDLKHRIFLKADEAAI